MKMIDHPLKPITRMLHKKAEEIAKAYGLFLDSKAIKDHRNAQAMSNAPEGSIAARKVWVEAQSDYYNFMIDMNDAERKYEALRLEFKVLECEYYAQLAAYKIEHKIIERGHHD